MEHRLLSQLEQDPDELLDNYLHCVSELLPKMYHTSDMSSISAMGTNHYAVVYGLNCRKLKDSISGHWSVQWMTMEECFRDICNIGAGYERVKGYCRADFNTPEASTITEVKTLREPGMLYKWRGPHFQNNCMNHKSNNNNKFQNKNNNTVKLQRKQLH